MPQVALMKISSRTTQAETHKFSTDIRKKSSKLHQPRCILLLELHQMDVGEISSNEDLYEKVYIHDITKWFFVVERKEHLNTI